MVGFYRIYLIFKIIVDAWIVGFEIITSRGCNPLVVVYKSGMDYSELVNELEYDLEHHMRISSRLLDAIRDSKKQVASYNEAMDDAYEKASSIVKKDFNSVDAAIFCSIMEGESDTHGIDFYYLDKHFGIDFINFLQLTFINYDPFLIVGNYYGLNIKEYDIRKVSVSPWNINLKGGRKILKLYTGMSDKNVDHIIDIYGRDVFDKYLPDFESSDLDADIHDEDDLQVDGECATKCRENFAKRYPNAWFIKELQ